MAIPTIQIDNNKNALRLASAISLLLNRAIESLNDAPPSSVEAESLSDLLRLQTRLINLSLTPNSEKGV